MFSGRGSDKKYFFKRKSKKYIFCCILRNEAIILSKDASWKISIILSEPSLYIGVNYRSECEIGESFWSPLKRIDYKNIVTTHKNYEIMSQHFFLSLVQYNAHRYTIIFGSIFLIFFFFNFDFASKLILVRYYLWNANIRSIELKESSFLFLDQ